MKALAICVLFSIAVRPAWGQGVGQYGPVVRSFLQKVGRANSYNSLRYSDSGKLVEAVGSDFMVTVNPQEGRVCGWFDDRPGIDPATDPGSGYRIHDIEEAKAKARQWLVMVGIECPPFESSVERKPMDQLQAYTMKFQERPNGYRGGATQFITVTVNAFTGEVTDMMRSLQYTYDDPEINVTAAQAQETARTKLRERFGVEPTGLTVAETAYFVPMIGELFAGDGEPSPNKRSRLAYRIEAVIQTEQGASRANVFVDAKTGQVIGGGVARASVAPASKPTGRAAEKETPQAPSGPPMPLFAGAVLVLGGAGYVAYRRMRRV